MNNQSLTTEILGGQARGNNTGAGGAIGVNDQTTQITTVTVGEGPQVVIGGLRIPVPARRETSHSHAVGIDTRITAAVAVEMESVLALGQTSQMG